MVFGIVFVAVAAALKRGGRFGWRWTDGFGSEVGTELVVVGTTDGPLVLELEDIDGELRSEREPEVGQ